MIGVIYDGHDFSEICICGDPKLAFHDMRSVEREADGIDGSKVVGTRLAKGTVEFTCTLLGRDAMQRRMSLSRLMAWLRVDGPRELVLPDMPSWSYMAVPSGKIDLSRHVDAEQFQLSFAVVDPVAYGDEHSAEVPSGGSVTLHVGGTAPTRPTVAAQSAVRNSTSHAWGVRLDSADYMHVDTGSSSAHAVSLDCGARAALLDGVPTVMTLTSDWLELTPGKHVLEMDEGTGAATVTWRERWY